MREPVGRRERISSPFSTHDAPPRPDPQRPGAVLEVEKTPSEREPVARAVHVQRPREKAGAGPSPSSPPTGRRSGRRDASTKRAVIPLSGVMRYPMADQLTRPPPRVPIHERRGILRDAHDGGASETNGSKRSEPAGSRCSVPSAVPAQSVPRRSSKTDHIRSSARPSRSVKIAHALLLDPVSPPIGRSDQDCPRRARRPRGTSIARESLRGAVAQDCPSRKRRRPFSVTEPEVAVAVGIEDVRDRRLRPAGLGLDAGLVPAHADEAARRAGAHRRRGPPRARRRHRKSVRARPGDEPVGSPGARCPTPPDPQRPEASVGRRGRAGRSPSAVPNTRLSVAEPEDCRARRRPRASRRAPRGAPRSTWKRAAPPEAAGTRRRASAPDPPSSDPQRAVARLEEGLGRLAAVTLGASASRTSPATSNRTSSVLSDSRLSRPVDRGDRVRQPESRSRCRGGIGKRRPTVHRWRLRRVPGRGQRARPPRESGDSRRENPHRALLINARGRSG